MLSRYPASFSGIKIWAAENRVPLHQARTRFAQYGILQSIAGSRVLSNTWVFKGGNALDFIWQPNRSTVDLDFSSREANLNVALIRQYLEPSLQRTAKMTGTLYRLQKMIQQPPGPNKTFITFLVVVGYALSDDLKNQARVKSSLPSLAAIPVEISINEPICASEAVDVQSSNTLQVSTEEDIVAEKLRALLQQIPRNRHRPQDVLDIGVLLARGTHLRPDVVAAYLKNKAASRNVQVSLDLFRADELWVRASENYDALKDTTRELFIPFTDAKQAVLRFVEMLPL